MGKIPTIRVTREEMRKRVALFSELKGSDGGLPDSRYPSAVRTLYNVIGFQPPEGDPDKHSPVGANSSGSGKSGSSGLPNSISTFARSAIQSVLSHATSTSTCDHLRSNQWPPFARQSAFSRSPCCV